MIIKVPIKFPDDFYPPKKFDGVEEEGMTEFCVGCPLYVHDTYEAFEYCALGHMVENDECPIRPLFPKIH